jgi:hypothetical protein
MNDTTNTTNTPRAARVTIDESIAQTVASMAIGAYEAWRGAPESQCDRASDAYGGHIGFLTEAIAFAPNVLDHFNEQSEIPGNEVEGVLDYEVSEPLGNAIGLMLLNGGMDEEKANTLMRQLMRNVIRQDSRLFWGLTKAEHHAAKMEGWHLTVRHGRLDIACVDQKDMPLGRGVFGSDFSAIGHVYYCARRGSDMHRRALLTAIGQEVTA